MLALAAAKSESGVSARNALRMRAHDHFVSQKMTDCSSPKEESLPIQNRNRAGALQNHSETGIKTGRANSISTASFLIQSALTNSAGKDLLNDGCEVKAFTAKVAKKSRKGRQASPAAELVLTNCERARSVGEMAFERL